MHIARMQIIYPARRKAYVKPKERHANIYHDDKVFVSIK
jgi:hypothetical protein